MPPRRKSRIYTRTRGGQTRYYADFRDYADVGGGREALIARGESFATTDPDVANRLAQERLQELEAKRRKRGLLGVEKETTLSVFAAEHLVKKAEEETSAQWLSIVQRYLERAIHFFGEIRPKQLGREPGDPDLAAIDVSDVREWMSWLSKLPSGRAGGKTLGPGSVRHHLNALSNLYSRAASEGYVPPGYNPVAALIKKPSGRRLEAEWFEVHEAALYLEAARRAPELLKLRADTFGRRLEAAISRWLPDVPPPAAQNRLRERLRALGMRCHPDQIRAYIASERIPAPSFIAAAAEVLEVDPAWLRRGGKKKTTAAVAPYFYPLVATLLLTGGRETEILGLDVADVSLDRKIIHIRPNRWRGLKTPGSTRVVRIWPQLEEILREWIYGGDGPRPEGLLFPSERTGGLITDIRKPLDTVAKLAGWEPGEIRSKRFRHTYASARLQTLDNGAPVQPWTVARELGHQSLEMVNRIYGHLGEIRHRSEVVEYRVEQHLDVKGFAERLESLQPVPLGR